jgi:hypothetical protein
MRSGCASAQVRFGEPPSVASFSYRATSSIITFGRTPHRTAGGMLRSEGRRLQSDAANTHDRHVLDRLHEDRSEQNPVTPGRGRRAPGRADLEPTRSGRPGGTRGVPRAFCPGEDHLLFPRGLGALGRRASCLAAVGTIAAVGAAVWLTVQEGKRRSAEDRRQAERITAWVAADDPEGSLVVSLGGASRGGLRPKAPLQWRNFVSQLPPGETRVEVDRTTGANGRPSVGIAFQDAAGVTGGTVGNTNRRTFPDIPQARP